ncbi:MAG: hypothetical protein ABW213_04995 [Tardiphaga sp.]
MLAVALDAVSRAVGVLVSVFSSALASDFPLASGAAASRVPLPDPTFGTVLREIGRGLGRGTLSLAQASPLKAAKLAPATREAVREIDRAVDRNAAERAKRGTAFLRGWLINPHQPWSIEKVNKY